MVFLQWCRMIQSQNTCTPKRMTRLNCGTKFCIRLWWRFLFHLRVFHCFSHHIFFISFRSLEMTHFSCPFSLSKQQFEFQCSIFDSTKWILLVIYFQFHLRIPFDWKTPIGFPIAALMQVIFFEAMAQAVSCALAMLIGFFWFMMALGESLQRKIYDLNRHYKADRNDYHWHLWFYRFSFGG